jgi:hypothetical protein
MSKEVEVLKINYKDWLLSAYNYYIAYDKETLFDDFTWDKMYYDYMRNIDSFPFLKKIGMSDCASLFYVKKSQFEEELKSLGVDL